MKKIIIGLILGISFFAINFLFYRQGQKVETPIEQPLEEPVSKQDELKTLLENRINKYNNVDVTQIALNKNYGNGETETFIGIVRFNFIIANTPQTAKEYMKMVSNDLVAFTANQGVTEIDQFAIFWRDDYNDRNLKYSYEFRENNFFLTEALE